MKCQKCGETLKEGNIFCTSCGHKQLPALPPKILACDFILLLVFGVFSIVLNAARFEGCVMYLRNDTSDAQNGLFIGAPTNSAMELIALLGLFLLCLILTSLAIVMRTKITLLFTGIIAIITMFVSVIYFAIVPITAPNNYCEYQTPYIIFGIIIGLLIVLHFLFLLLTTIFKDKQIVPIVTKVICTVVSLICFICYDAICSPIGLMMGYFRLWRQPDLDYIIIEILLTISSIAGIYLGNIIRRKFSTIYYLG